MTSKYKNNKEGYDKYANYRNTPHLRENTTIIFLAYLFSGMNFIFAGKFLDKVLDIRVFPHCILGGVVLLVMAIVSLLDKRKEMRSTPYVIGMAIVHCMCSSIFFPLLSLGWIGIYVCEVVLSIIIVLFIHNR